MTAPPLARPSPPPTPPFRVLHVTEALGGGVATAIESYVARTSGRVEHIVLANRRPGHDVGDNLEASTTFVALSGGRLGGVRALKRLVAQESPDVVHAHSSVAGVWARAARLDVPVVYTPHCFAFERTDVRRLARAAFWGIERVLADRTALFIANGAREAELCQSLAASIPVVSVPCTPVGRTATAARPEPAAGGPLTVTMVGRVMAQKDPRWFAEFARHASKLMGPAVAFRWIGGGDDDLEAELRAAGVEVTGWCSRDEVASWLRRADVYVHSAAWEASCPLAVMEAVQAGLAPVVRDIPAMAGVGFDAAPTPMDAARMVVGLADPPARAAAVTRAAAILSDLDDEAAAADLTALYGSLPPTPAAADRPLSVLLVFGSQVFGGAEQWLFDLIDAGDGRAEYRALLLAPSRATMLLEARGIPYETIPTGRRPWHIAASTAQLARRLRHDPPDVILANGVKSAFTAIPAARLLGVRCVWAKHDFVWDQPAGRLAARLVDDMVASSSELLDAVGRPDGVVIMPPPPAVARTRVEAQAFWQDRGIDVAGRPTLGMVCRIIGYKGVDDAIKALAYPEARDWQLVVVGDEDSTAPGTTAGLVALSFSLGVQDRVIWAGPVPRASDWLAAFDGVAVLTKSHPDSRYRREGFSITVIEAAFAGVPVVATEGTPALRFIGVAGVTVPPNSCGDVAAALSTLLERRAAAERVREALIEGYPSSATSALTLHATLAQAAARAGAHGHPGEGPRMSVVTTVLNEAGLNEAGLNEAGLNEAGLNEAGGGLAALLAALTAQLRDGDEIVVVDGGSTDGTLDLLYGTAHSDPRVRVVSAPGTNISAGRNAGIRAARNDVIAVTDAGVVIAAGWLDALRGAFVGADIDLVTGAYEATAVGAVQEAFRLVGYPRVQEGLHPTPLVRAYGRLLGRVFDAELCTGRSVAFTRAAAAAVGGFLEELATAEDVTFGRRIVASGGRAVLALDARVQWVSRPTVAKTLRMYAGYGRGDAASGDRKLIGRNLLRGAAYVGGPIMLAFGGRKTRAVAVAGGAFYASLPLQRARAERASFKTFGLIPFAMAGRDLAKASGCVQGIVASRRDPTGAAVTAMGVASTGQDSTIDLTGAATIDLTVVDERAEAIGD
jgi:glycosyltransferase involved in cell wall biosynthesis